LPPQTQTVAGRQELVVTTFNGEAIKIIFSPDWTVQQLKQTIQEKTGLNDEQMGLMRFGGRPLANGLRLAQCNIRNHSTVVLATPVKGG
jgi:hypothetical protein